MSYATHAHGLVAESCADAEEQEKWEVLEEKRVNLPRLPQPYAFLPTTATKKRKTQYEALASELSTDRVAVELYGSPDRSASGVYCRLPLTLLKLLSLLMDQF